MIRKICIYIEICTVDLYDCKHYTFKKLFVIAANAHNETHIYSFFIVDIYNMHISRVSIANGLHDISVADTGIVLVSAEPFFVAHIPDKLTSHQSVG